MSRQIVMNRRGKTIGYIDTAQDGQQSAVSQRGVIIGVFNPRTSETLTPTGNRLSEGNLLTQMLRQA